MNDRAIGSDRRPALLAGRYHLMDLLGGGGMGRVWEAYDNLLDRRVAVKEISPEGLPTAELDLVRSRAIREARAIARIDHPNVVRVFDVFVVDDAPWIVMELIPSRSLWQIVDDDGLIRPERAARIGLEVLAGLRAAHRVGILHRDVKPANILIRRNGQAVLTDFGVAAFAGDSGITRTGVFVGSPSFLAPERLSDGPLGPSSDLWSLGATLFAIVEGHAPYEKSTPMSTLAALMVEAVPAPQRAGTLSQALEGLLRKDPLERVGAEEAEELLRRAEIRHADSSAPAPHAPPNPQSLPTSSVPTDDDVAAGNPHRWRAIASTIAVVTIIAMVSAVLGNRLRATSEASAGAPGSAPASPSASAQPAPAAAAPPASAEVPTRRPPSTTGRVTRPASARPSKANRVVDPSTRTLGSIYNNVAVTDDADTTTGDFDGGGATYSAQALAAAGTKPGAELTVGGVSLTWPSAAGTGRRDNAIATGQTIGVPGTGRTLAFLVAADYGTASGSGMITYVDGTTQTFVLSSPDWTDVGNAAAVAVARYQNRPDGVPYEQQAAIFGTTVRLTNDKSVASVRLPFAGVVPARTGTATLHVFAAVIG